MTIRHKIRRPTLYILVPLEEVKLIFPAVNFDGPADPKG
jgi:hypothetical protein